MAVTAVTILEVAATGSDGNAGSDNNAGAFDPSTNTANYVADLTTDSNTGNTSTPVISSATFNFAAGDASSWIFLIGGASWTLPNVTLSGVATTPTGIFVKISSVASNKATVDAAIGHVVCYGTAGIYAVSDTVGVSTQATPSSGKGAIDYSRTGTPIVSNTDLASSNGTNATPTVTSASRTFDKRDIGNHLYISAGTNWTTGIFRITDTSAGGAILDRACGSAASLSSGTFVEGGCLASPGAAGRNHVGGNHIYIKNATYTITSASTNIAGGCMSLTNPAANSQMTWVIGYNAYRPDSPKTTSRPLLQASGISTFTVVLGSVSLGSHLIVDGAGLTSSRGVTLFRGDYITAKNCTNSGLTSGDYFMCDATGCSSQTSFSGVILEYCVCWSNTIHGFVNPTCCINCLSINNSGASTNGYLGSGASSRFINCTAYGNGKDGFQFASLAINTQATCVNCLSYGNTGLGFTCTAATNIVLLYNCAAGNNSTNFGTNISFDSRIGCITLTADPFTNAAGSDFSLNNNAGGGASCRAAGVCGAFPGISTTTYIDIGAVQHQDSGGTAGMLYRTGIRELV